MPCAAPVQTSDVEYSCGLCLIGVVMPKIYSRPPSGNLRCIVCGYGYQEKDGSPLVSCRHQAQQRTRSRTQRIHAEGSETHCGFAQAFSRAKPQTQVGAVPISDVYADFLYQPRGEGLECFATPHPRACEGRAPRAVWQTQALIALPPRLPIAPSPRRPPRPSPRLPQSAPPYSSLLTPYLNLIPFGAISPRCGILGTGGGAD